jgi:ribonucleoside-diphosphate reductase beta chain
MTVFNAESDSSKKRHLTAKLFLDVDGGVDIARYDQLKYPEIDALTQKMLGFFWRPEEVDINQDRSDFTKLSDHARNIFTLNLRRQILLDSIQGRSPALSFLRVVSNPELETAIETWSFFETIHSRSYTHIIRNIYPNPSEIFDTMLDIPEIVDCANDISRYYDDLIDAINVWETLGTKGIHLYDLKKKLWLCLNSVNVLEGIRFYVSFACSWAFAESKQMEGNAKIIKQIARDENLHLSLTQRLIKTWLKQDDPDFIKIAEETQDECVEIFKSAIKQEIEWARYLFKDGSILGLNEQLLEEYVLFIGAQRMKAVGLPVDFEYPKRDPLPWTRNWIASKGTQVAPQETEISSYIVGGINNDLDISKFDGFKL